MVTQDPRPAVPRSRARAPGLRSKARPSNPHPPASGSAPHPNPGQPLEGGSAPSGTHTLSLLDVAPARWSAKDSIDDGAARYTALSNSRPTHVASKNPKNNPTKWRAPRAWIWDARASVLRQRMERWRGFLRTHWPGSASRQPVDHASEDAESESGEPDEDQRGQHDSSGLSGGALCLLLRRAADRQSIRSGARRSPAFAAWSSGAPTAVADHQRAAEGERSHHQQHYHSHGDASPNRAPASPLRAWDGSVGALCEKHKGYFNWPTKAGHRVEGIPVPDVDGRWRLIVVEGEAS
jgi:hypothetical protein